MQLSTRLSVILACIVAAAAIPLNLEPEEGELSTELKDATTEANARLVKMKETIIAAQGGDAAAKARVEMAFGPKTDKSVISASIDKLAAGKMPVSQERPKGINAETHFKSFRTYNADYTLPDIAPHVDVVKFGTNFYNNKVQNGDSRATAVLHEAAHAILGAEDDYLNTKPREMLPAAVDVPGFLKSKVVTDGGYTANPRVLITPDNPVTEEGLPSVFKDVRNDADNMYLNADSWALYGHLCSLPRLLKRALLEDDPVAYYLAKRDGASCKPPPEYFAKKAAAKAAREKAASTSSTASKAGVAKTTDKKAAGVGSGSQKTIKGGERLSASKSGLKTLGKSRKSTRPKAFKSGLSKGSKAKAPTSRGRLSNSRTSKLSSKASKGALKGSMPKSLKANASRPLSKTSKVKTSKPFSKSSKFTRPKSVKVNAPRPSSKKGVGSKASTTRPQGSRAKQTSNQLSKPRAPNASNSRSSKMTSATRKLAAVRPNTTRTRTSTPAQKVTKTSPAPNVAKARSKPVVDPLKAAALRRMGKPQ